MNIAYIILAHNNPEHVVRLVNALYQINHRFLIHIDKSVNIQPFTHGLDELGINNVVYLKRYKSKWGSIGLLKASLSGIYEAVKHNVDYTILVSGSHYPIKSNAAIADFLTSNNGKSFLSYYRMPAPYWKPDKEINRIRKYYFHIGEKLFEYPMSRETTSVKRKIINLLLAPFLPNQRNSPPNIDMYGGEFWFCLTKDACEELITYNQETPQLMRFLKYALIPDEIFYQTALFNLKNEKLRLSIKNNCLTHINWKDKNSPSPENFNDDDYDNLKQSDALFARKFEPLENSRLLRRIDELIGQSSSQNK